MGVDDIGGQNAELFDVVIPACEEIRLFLGFGDMFSHRVGGGAGHRGDAGVIEKVPFAQDREFFCVADEMTEVVHACLA